MSTSLTSSYSSHALSLKNRMVMAPMTRCRALKNIPNDLMATYYEQRSEAGLIITEGTAPSPNGLGYARIPGLYSKEHVEGWKKITEKVHAKGTKIFVQLMHTGRVSQSLNMPTEARILAPSDLALEGTMYTDSKGMQPHGKPTAMSGSDVKSTIEEFAHSAALALQAGFDGVELHAANGYLIEQFLNPCTNTRTDEWGGSPTKRNAFLLEIIKRTAERIGNQKIGVRLSPYGVFNGMAPFAELDAQYAELVSEMARHKLAYLHLLDHAAMGAPAVPDSIKVTLRKNFEGTVIHCGGFDLATANKILGSNSADLIAFGRPFLANPNLLTALEKGVTLQDAPQEVLYTPDAKGYTDYKAI